MERSLKTYCVTAVQGDVGLFADLKVVPESVPPSLANRSSLYSFLHSPFSESHKLILNPMNLESTEILNHLGFIQYCINRIPVKSDLPVRRWSNHRCQRQVSIIAGHIYLSSKLASATKFTARISQHPSTTVITSSAGTDSLLKCHKHITTADTACKSECTGYT